MYGLIKKDIMVQKKVVMVAVLLIIYFMFFFHSEGPTGLIAGITVVTYILTIGASTIDDRNKSEILLNSLPIKRRTIVLAKYLSALIFATCAIVVYSIIYFIVGIFQIPFNVISFSFEGLVGSYVAIALLCSINLPIIFKFGYIKSRVATMILYFLLFFGTISVGNKLTSKSWLNNALYVLNDMSGLEVSIWIILISIVMLSISIKISISFYNKREFN
jgi:ABC-2 type transport system permease protein